MELKVCCTCKENKELILFSKNKSKGDGFSSSCKTYHSYYRKQRYAENKEKEIAQVKTYQSLNPLSKEDGYKSGRRFKSLCKNKYCSNTTLVSKKDLEKETLKFCSRECAGLNTRMSLFYNYLKGVEKRAKKKNYNFNLTEAYLENLLNTQNNRCAVTNIPITLKHKSEATRIYESASLDRIESSKGYVEGNVQWVILGVNYMKLNHSNEDLLKTISLILKNNKEIS